MAHGAWLRTLAATVLSAPAAIAFAEESVVTVVSTDVDPDPSLTPSEHSYVAATSADGRYVALLTDSIDLLPGQVGPAAGRAQLYLVDTTSGARWMVSHKADLPTTACNAPTDAAAVSRDGSWVAFESRCSDLVPGQIDPGVPADSDIFLWSRAANSAVLVNHAIGAPATVANEEAKRPDISSDGRFVGYESTATNLVVGQVDGGSNDVFLFDRTIGESLLVSHSTAGPTTAGNGSSALDGLSDDASWVLFSSSANNLVGGFDDNSGNGSDFFLFERATGAITLVSHVPGNSAATGNAGIYDGTIDGGGAHVAFTSLGTDYVPGMVDGNGPLSTDVFLWHRASDSFALLSDNAGGTASGNDRSTEARISRNGEFVVFRSEATDLVGGTDGNNGTDAFLATAATGATTLVSHAAGSPTAAADRISEEVSIGDSGRFVLYRSAASNLVAGQIGNNQSQIFLFDRLGGGSTLMSHAIGAPTTSANDSAGGPLLAAAAGKAIFHSGASNLAAGDLNNRIDVFASAVVLFADGFESGDLLAWSSTAP